MARDEKAISYTQRVMKAMWRNHTVGFEVIPRPKTWPWNEEYYRGGFEFLLTHLGRLQTTFTHDDKRHTQIPDGQPLKERFYWSRP